ncbi:MAG TPA: hypothetical protein VKB86_18645 [Pyrinomonadaceae bacterium]|nr:hypothetical protein [Pyrinomonadaceae bacterium]
MSVELETRKMMLSLFAKPLNRAAHSARRLLPALLFTMLATKTAAAAVPLQRYQASIHQAVVELKALEQWADGETPTQYAARVTATFKDIRNSVLADDAIEWDGGTIHANNSWLETELQSYERLSNVQKFFALALITEHMQALEDRLSELHGQRKVSAERKSEEKARLESILRRDEFVEKQPQENAITRMWKRFLEWWNNLFPRGNGLAPGQTSWLSLIALIVVFGLAAGVIGYAAWKLLPFFERRRAR